MTITSFPSCGPFPFFFLVLVHRFFLLFCFNSLYPRPPPSPRLNDQTVTHNHLTHSPIFHLFHSHFFFVSFLFQLSFSLFLLVYHFPHSFLSPSLSLSLFFLFLFLFFYSAMHDNIGRRRCYCTPFFVPLKQTKPPNRNSCKLLNSPSPISKYFLSFSYFFFT